MSWFEDLAQTLARERRNRNAGTVVVLDFLRAEEQEALRQPLQRAFGDAWGVYVVGDPHRRAGAITADRAVDLREDLARRSFFLIIRDEAGAGLQGVYDVAEVLQEPEVFHRLRTALRNDLRGVDRKLEAAAWKACQVARPRQGAAERFYRREIEYFDALRSSPSWEAGGEHLHLLGLIPDRELAEERLAANASLVRDLMKMERGTHVSHSERVRRLKLKDAEVEAGVAKVLEEASSLFALDEWLPRLHAREFTFDRWQKETDMDRLESMELQPWRQSSQKPYKWSGLDEHPEHGLFFSLADESPNDTLEVRWKTSPPTLPRGAVEYCVQLLPA